MRENGLPEHAIVRRRGELVFGNVHTPAPFTADIERRHEHVGSRITVAGEVVWPMITEDGRLKGPPQLHLNWHFHGGSGRVVGYRKKDGFGTEENPGTQIVNSRGGGTKVECLEPGDYFYSFFTVTTFLGILDIPSREVQFSQTVPNVAGMLKIMKQGIEYEELRQRYHTLTRPPELPKPPPPPHDPTLDWQNNFQLALQNAKSRFEASEQFHKEWQQMRKQIKNGPGSTNTKKMQLERLAGRMKSVREKFEL